jgi:hypothetical protein
MAKHVIPDLPTIDLGALEAVTGGRITRGEEAIDPALIQGIGELAKAVASVGQNMAAVKSQTDGQWMQMFQQMMQAGFGRR